MFTLALKKYFPLNIVQVTKKLLLNTSETCSVANGGCHHNCLDGKSGPKCSCHEKYRLKADGKTCLGSYIYLHNIYFS